MSGLLRRLWQPARSLIGTGLLAAGWYATQVEPRWLRIIRRELTVPDLPPAFDGYRVVHLSDLHLGMPLADRQLPALVAAAHRERPDLVAITGDLLTNRRPARTDALGPVLAELRAPDGVWSVTGNHDHSAGIRRLEALLHGTGITLLRNAHTLIERDGEQIALAGVDDVVWSVADLHDALAGVPAGCPAILLAHEPDFARIALADRRVFLQLSGHTHGGQVRLPGLGALALPQFGHLFVSGTYQVGRLALSVSHGTGTGRFAARFNCRPDFAVITLRRGPSNLAAWHQQPDDSRRARLKRRVVVAGLRALSQTGVLKRMGLHTSPILPPNQRPPWESLRPMPASRVSDRRPIVIGHRGASALAPENTLAAFRVAAEVGADGVEFDVQRTRDGQLVVIHDDEVDRTTNGTGLVREMTLDELRALDAGAWFGAAFQGERVPTLREVFDWARGTDLLLFIELKDPWQFEGIEAQVVELVRAFDLAERAQVRSFYHAALHTVYALDPAIPLSELWLDRLPADDEITLPTVNALQMLYTPDEIARLHGRGVQITAWTVDQPRDVERLVRAEIDGLTTNHPDRVIAQVEALRGR